MVSVGRCRLSDLLRSRGLTQADLERLTGIPKGRVSNYVHRNRVMSLATAKQVSEILRCRIEDLYEWHHGGEE